MRVEVRRRRRPTRMSFRREDREEPLTRPTDCGGACFL